MNAYDGEKRRELFRQTTDLIIDIHELRKVITENGNKIKQQETAYNTKSVKYDTIRDTLNAPNATVFSLQDELKKMNSEQENHRTL